MRIFCPAIASSVSLSSYRLLVADPAAFRPPRSGVSHPLRAARAGAGSRRSRRSIGSPSGPVACASLSSPRTVGRAEPLQGRRCRHWSSPRVKQPVHSARGRGPDPNRAPLPPAGAPTRRRHAGTPVPCRSRRRAARRTERPATLRGVPPGRRAAVSRGRSPGRRRTLAGAPSRRTPTRGGWIPASSEDVVQAPHTALVPAQRPTGPHPRQKPWTALWGPGTRPGPTVTGSAAPRRNGTPQITC